MRRKLPILVVASALTSVCHAQVALERRNWFDDPFFQISGAIAHCPVPLGPRLTEAEMRAQAHHRVERGTTCWLSGQCDRPNSFAYDRDIAKAIQSATQASDMFNDSALWITVQGRTVLVEGCVKDRALERQLEAFMLGIRYVQLAVAVVYSDLAAQPPYKPLSPP